MYKNSKHWPVCCALPWLLGTGVSENALADTAAESSEPVLQEIVISAQRRTESAQTIPIALSVVSGDDLAKENVFTVNDLQNVTPALSVQDAGITKFINIRGVGLNGSSPGLSTGVAYHVDGLYTRELGLSTPFYDLARIEVLRGPQGTIAGQNATGGGIFVVSKTPDYTTTGGNATVSYGDYRHLTADGAVNLPIYDNVAFRIAVYEESRDSYFANYQTGNTSPSSFQPGNLERTAARATLAMKPSDALEIILRAEDVDQRTDGFAAKYFNDGFPNYFALNINTPTKADLDSERVSAEVKYNITDGIQLRSLSGYQTYRVNNVYGTDGAPYMPVPLAQNIYQTIYSQEINVLSTGTSALNWVAGVYYFDIPGSHSKFTGPGEFIESKPYSKSSAFFGQATYRVTDLVEVVAGARYNSDVGGTNHQNQQLGPFPLMTVPATSEKTNATTGKLGVNFYFGPEHTQFVYALASKGYRAGGVNISGTDFGPESNFNYEGGWKSTLLNDHLRFQVDYFYDTYKDVQLSFVDPETAIPTVENGGTSKVKGPEAQFQAVFGGLSIDGSAAYVDSSLGAYLLPSLGGAPIQIAGRPLPLAPKQTDSIGAEYAFTVGPNDEKLTPRVQFSHTDFQWATAFEDRATDYLNSHNLLNASLTFAKGKWLTSLYGTNMTDSRYKTGQGFTGGYYIGNPREYGVRISGHF